MRILADIISIFAIVFLPWWGAAFVIIACFVSFDFFEAIVFGLILDKLYGIPDSLFSAHGFFITALLLYLILLYARPYLKEV